MKKIILLGGVLFCAGLAMAQSATVTPPKSPPTKTVTLPASTIKPETVMATNGTATTELIEKNIDRRLMYFNRYKKTDDMESLAKLISGENKDFYINFIKYIGESPLFTLKRNTSVKIVKTPTGEYLVSVTMTIDGTDKNVSMTFVEEKSETGSKWLIVDSNLHIQNPVSKSGNNLASSAVNKNTPPTTKTKVTREIPKDTGERTVTTLPIVSKPTTETPKNSAGADPATVTAPEIVPPKGVSNMTIIIIALGIIVGIAGGVFGFIKWKHKHAAVAAAVAATTVVASAAPLVNPTINNVPEVAPSLPIVPPVESNVTISTVEKITLTQNETVAPVSDSLENTAPIAPIPETTEPETSSAPEVVSETMPDPVEETIATVPEEPTISEQETVPEKPVIEESINTEAPQAEEKKPVAGVFLQKEGVTESAEESQSLEQAMNDSPLFAQKTESPAEDNQPHALFDSIFTPAEASKPEAEGLFTDMLKSGS